ncbi:MAG TPA: hypothetical protein ENI93_06830 [Gammaproteobacteria bacterium]|nr:hypothetical protein [Gammaproteobacteria bacterium]
MRSIVCRLALAGLVILSGLGVAGAEVLKEDNVHVRTWNAFARNLEQLHRRLTSVEGIEVRTSIGGYAGKPKFYTEEDYYLDGRLISRVQREREHPENLHAIEVYIRDEQGRVIRDYAAAFLPHYRNAPVQTLITLHRYNGDLHAFRSFDASGYRIVERCDGHLGKKEVQLLLDEDEIDDAIGDPNGIMATPEYRACFGDLAEKAGKYLQPQ